MKHLLYSGILFLVFFLPTWGIAEAVIELRQATSMKAIPAQGYTPESWVLTPEAPDRLLLCAASKSGGTLSCRTAGEFRIWVRERPAAR